MIHPVLFPPISNRSERLQNYMPISIRLSFWLHYLTEWLSLQHWISPEVHKKVFALLIILGLLFMSQWQLGHSHVLRIRVIASIQRMDFDTSLALPDNLDPVTSTMYIISMNMASDAPAVFTHKRFKSSQCISIRFYRRSNDHSSNRGQQWRVCPEQMAGFYDVDDARIPFLILRWRWMERNGLIPPSIDILHWRTTKAHSMTIWMNPKPPTDSLPWSAKTSPIWTV